MENLRSKDRTGFVRVRRWWIFAPLALGLTIPLTITTEKPIFTFTLMGQKGEIFVQDQAQRKDLLWMGFTHSSEHVRVASAFYVDTTGLQPIETRMEGYGPGLSPRAELVSKNQLLTREGQAYGKLVLVVTRSTSHWLAFRGKRWNLSKYIPDDLHAYRFTLSLEQSD